MRSRVLNVQVSDTTDAYSSNEAQYKIIVLVNYPAHPRDQLAV